MLDIKVMIITAMMTGATVNAAAADNFNYVDERFADLQMLRYRVDGFEELNLKQKTFICRRLRYGDVISYGIRIVSITCAFAVYSKRYIKLRAACVQVMRVIKTNSTLSKHI